jgi:hypothetical protein
MTHQQLSTVIQSAFALAILLWMLMVCLPNQRLDIFRQQMFAVRDELFDYAHGGNIAFDHPAYLLLRKSMNGFIRYGHRLSFFQLGITLCRWHFADEKPVSRWQSQWEEALSTIDNEKVKHQLNRFHMESMGLVTSKVITGSPILLTVAVVLVLVVPFEGAWRSTADVRRFAAEKTLRLFSIDTNKLEDEALRCAA